MYPRWKVDVRRNLWKYLRCGAKLLTFCFWATLYMMVMKMTIFKSQTSEPVIESNIPDNFTRWLYNGPVIGDEEADKEITYFNQTDHEITQELQKRVEQVQTTCRLRNLYKQRINSHEFFVDHAHNLVWCNIFKAASSWWLYRFNILGGYDKLFLARSRENSINLARRKFPRPSEEEVKDAISNPGVVSLLVVREPFERLLSAYRDKLENIAPPYYRKLAKYIKDNYRKPSIERTTKVGPTFYEFVSYLINDKEKTFDEHWAPYYQFCSPCAVNFSVIAKVETLKRDSQHVLSLLGLNHMFGQDLSIVTNKRMRLRTIMNKSRDGKKTNVLLKEYFGQLDQNTLNGLLQIYGIDFEMFGYDPNVYYKYVKP